MGDEILCLECGAYVPLEFKENICRLCGEESNSILNVNMKAVSICNPCCNLITKQNLLWLINERVPELEKLQQNAPNHSLQDEQLGCGDVFEYLDTLGDNEEKIEIKCRRGTLCPKCEKGEEDGK